MRETNIGTDDGAASSFDLMTRKRQIQENGDGNERLSISKRKRSIGDQALLSSVYRY